MEHTKLPTQPGLKHFGEQLRGSKFGHKMTRDLYAFPSRSQHQRPNRERFGEKFWEATAWAFEDDSHTRHSDLFLLTQRDAALVNFDLSLAHFRSLDEDEFESALGRVLATNRKLKPVEDLQKWDGVEGTYVMVFDEYKQFYVGQSNDVRKRIRAHWTGRKSFDRLIWGSKYDSILPVDELRALDTTRIFAFATSNPFGVEQQAEDAADPQFCLNRMVGGEVAPLTLMLTAANPRKRSNGITSVPMTWEQHEHERQAVKDIIKSGGDNLVDELASLDMTIYAGLDEDGDSFMWTRRDAISGAAAQGKLSIEDYQAFLEAMGESIIWP